jgi:hypothetical protein
MTMLVQMPKGYAYMELEDEETAQIAMSMTGVKFMGRTVKVRCMIDSAWMAACKEVDV